MRAEMPPLRGEKSGTAEPKSLRLFMEAEAFFVVRKREEEFACC